MTIATGGVLTLVVGLIVGCPPVTPPDALPGVTEVRMESIAFSPKDVTIQRGESVRWTNFDIVPHTSTSGNPGDANSGSLWESGFLNSGQSFTHQFDDVGEFVYYCRVHPGMMRDATVTVVP